MYSSVTYYLRMASNETTGPGGHNNMKNISELQILSIFPSSNQCAFHHDIKSHKEAFEKLQKILESECNKEAKSIISTSFDNFLEYLFALITEDAEQMQTSNCDENIVFRRHAALICLLIKQQSAAVVSLPYHIDWIQKSSNFICRLLSTNENGPGEGTAINSCSLLKVNTSLYLFLLENILFLEPKQPKQFIQNIFLGGKDSNHSLGISSAVSTRR